MKTTALGNVKGLAVSKVHSLAQRGKPNRKKKEVCIAVSIAISLALANAEAREVSSREKVSFDIDAPSLVQALMQFTQQSGLQLMVPTGSATEAPAPRVIGSYTPTAALDQLLAGTAFKYEFANARTVAIRVADSNSRVPEQIQAQDGGSDGTGTPGDSATAGAHRDASDRTSADRVLGAQDAGRRGIPEVLVEGSRVTNIDLTRTEDDAQPYTILDSRQIARSGATNVEEFLKQQLTMNTALITNAQSRASFSGTTSSISLRGLGSNETLVLIDGRRAAGVSVMGTNYQPDINGIPLSAIERIEVLPTSASAIYGGAAVGGVVNVVLKKDFEGGQLDYAYDNVTDGHAPERTVSANYGMTFAEGRTQILLGGQYADGTSLPLGDRENLFSHNVSTTLANSPSFFYSPTRPFSGATPNISSSAGNLVLDNGTSLNSPITSVPAGARQGDDISSQLGANAGKYNLALSDGNGPFGLRSTFGTVPRTKSGYASLRQSLFRGTQVFAEFSANDNAGRTYINPFSSVYTVPATAPTSPFRGSVRVTFPSTTAALQTTESRTRSATLGFIVPLGREWSSELDYTWSKNSFELATSASDNTALNAALRAGTVNPFIDTLVSQQPLANYLAPEYFSGDSTLRDVNLRVSGVVSALAVPAGSPSVTVGLEHRREGTGDSRFDINYPITTANSIHQVFFGQSQSTDSVYVETLVPLVGGASRVPAVELLELQLAGRSERYTVSNGTAFVYLSPASLAASNPPQAVNATTRYSSTNPTIGLKYSPVRGFTFRTSFAKAFLPPTAFQLLRNPSSVCGGTPCLTIADPTTGTSYLVDYTSGGNPDLHPQNSRSWNAGFIWEPQAEALAGLRTNLEYYRIKQPNYITTPLVQQLISDPAFSSRVTRNPTTGLVTTVDASPLNASEYRTNGWDLKIDYRTATRFGVWDLHTVGTYINSDKRQYQIGSPFLEYAGYPNDGGEGKLKANATISWEYRHFAAAWTATYYSSYYQQFSPKSPLSLQNGVNPLYTDAQGSLSVPSQLYHDLYLTYSLGGAADGIGGGTLNRIRSRSSVQLGVRNVFNKTPPLDASFSPYLYSPYGDPRLRTYRVAVTFGF